MLKSLWRDVRASLNRIFAIVVKEFAVTFGDKGSRMVLIAPVFLQAILFGYGATFNLERVPWVLLDESHSSASAEIVRGITGNGIFDLKRNAVSLADFEKSIDSSEALVGVYFPNDFDRKGEMMVVRRPQLHDRGHRLRLHQLDRDAGQREARRRARRRGARPRALE